MWEPEVPSVAVLRLAKPVPGDFTRLWRSSYVQKMTENMLSYPISLPRDNPLPGQGPDRGSLSPCLGVTLTRV